MLRMKIRATITLAIALVELAVVRAQPTPNIERQLRAVADQILEHTSFTFVDKATQQSWTSTQGVPYSPSVVAESPYNQWEYWNGVLTIALLRSERAFNEPRYGDYARRNIRFIFDNLPYFQRQYQDKVRNASFHQFFRLSKLDDCGAMAAGVCDVYAVDPRADYLAYVHKAAEFILKRQCRLPDGTFARPEPRSLTLWADDLYMSVPFLARMGKLTGESRYFDEAAKQVENFTRYLYDPATGLYFHCWYSDVAMNGVAHWGRCNGWLMMAQVELLAHLPKDHPQRPALIALLQRQVAGIARYQDLTGLWHQVLDRPESYLESSCTAMFVYGIARGVNEGWLPYTYLSIAQNGWAGLSTKIQNDGQVADICIGTGIEDNLKFYYTRPTKLNDIHGLGAILLAGTELSKIRR